MHAFFDGLADIACLVFDAEIKAYAKTPEWIKQSVLKFLQRRAMKTVTEWQKNYKDLFAFHLKFIVSLGDSHDLHPQTLKYSIFIYFIFPLI